MSNSFKTGELTVGELLDFIEKYKIPRDAKVFYQRIEDRYFNGVDISGMRGKREDGSFGIMPPGSKANGWNVVKKEGHFYHSALRFNKNIEEGEFEDKTLQPHSEERLESFKEQYIVAQAPVKYENDDNLYIDAHY